MESTGSHAGRTAAEYSQVAMRIGASTRYYLLSDHLGGTNVTVTTAGTEYGEVRYKAFGATRYVSGTTPTTYRYTGQRQESSLGLYYYGARWYDAALGRFIQADSIVPNPGDPVAFDRYAYTRNNPVNLVDPSGHGYCDGNNAAMEDEALHHCKPSSLTSQNPWQIPDDFPLEDELYIRYLYQKYGMTAEQYFLQEVTLPVPGSQWGPFAGCNTLTKSCDDGRHPGSDSRGANGLGVPIYSAAYGTVVYVGEIGGFGNYIIVEHNVYGTKFYSVYAHLQSQNVQVGDSVDATSQIGTMGNSSGVNPSNISIHLHFEVRKATNISPSYSVGEELWWPETRSAMYYNFVDLSLLLEIDLDSTFTSLKW